MGIHDAFTPDAIEDLKEWYDEIEEKFDLEAVCKEWDEFGPCAHRTLEDLENMYGPDYFPKEEFQEWDDKRMILHDYLTELLRVLEDNTAVLYMANHDILVQKPPET